MDGFLIIANIIFIILLLISSLLTIISLPGNILLLISMLLYGLYDNFIHLTYYDILIVIVLLIIGEVIEFINGPVLAKAKGASTKTVIFTGIAMIIGGVVLGAIGRVWNISVSLDIFGYLGMIGIIVIGTVLAFSMYLIGVNLIGPMRASLIAAVEPLSATICMCLWLHSPFTLIDVLGFIMIMSTIFILSYKKKS